MKYLVLANVLKHTSSNDIVTSIHNEVVSYLKSKDAKLSNKNIRKATKDKLKATKVPEESYNEVVEAVLKKHKEMKASEEEKSEEKSDEQTVKPKTKDFPKAKGQEYRSILERVRTKVKEKFQNSTKGYASETEISKFVSEVLDQTEYRYLSNNLNDVTSDILKKMKTKKVYVFPEEKK